MKLFIITFIFFFSTTSEIKQIINKPVISDHRADVLLKKLSDAYESYGQVGVDAVLDNEPVWYGGIDLYINTDSDSAIDMLKSDDNATYHIAKSVVIETDEAENGFIILVVSY